MKFLCALLVISAVYLKEIHGGIVQNQFNNIENFKNEIDEELSKLALPALKAARDLRSKVTLYKTKRSEMKQNLQQFNFNIDTEACQELSNTLEKAGDLAWNATLNVYHMVLSVSDTLANVTGCIGWNPIDTAKCYVDNINKVVTTIKSIKPTIMKSINEIMSMTPKLEPLFLQCIGDGPITTTTTTTTTPSPTATLSTTTSPTTTTTTTTTTPLPKATLSTTTSPTTTSQPSATTTKKPWWHFW